MSTTTAWFVPLRHLAPESLEQYLEEQAARGRHVVEFDNLSALRLTFDDAAPAQVRYVLDQRGDAPADYYASRERLGWEHTGLMGDLHVWRQEYSGERPAGLVGARAYHRAGVASVALAAVAVVTLIAAIALGIVSAIDPTTAATPRDFWAPAIAFGATGIVAAIVAVKLGFTHRSQTLAHAPELAQH